jgi:DNA-binding PadR family transcriptional regulator
MATPEMREPTFLLLTALAAGPRHGYALIADVEAVSDGRVRLRPGTLYAALTRMAEQRLVVVEREEVVNSRLRRYYRLTTSGAAELDEAARRMRKTADTAVRRLRTAQVTA